VKVTVSIPDSVFNDADWLARDLNVSRSAIYARALAVFIGQHVPDRVTQAMNDTIDTIVDERDAFAAAAARRVLDRSEW
jgi:hypothetical protein